MKKLLLPIILFLVGTGGGVGAAIFLDSAPTDDASEEVSGHCPPTDAVSEGTDETLGVASAAMDMEPSESGVEFARLNNQFIVPVVELDRVSALVVLSITIEVVSGEKEAVFEREPRLRDALLQVMFDHANQGGFDGVFTASDNMGSLRTALRNVARQAVGPEVLDVLVLDLVRQEVPG